LGVSTGNAGVGVIVTVGVGVETGKIKVISGNGIKVVVGVTVGVAEGVEVWDCVLETRVGD